MNAYTCKSLVLHTLLRKYASHLYPNIYIFIAVTLDESIFLDVLYSPMKNIKSHDLEATPMGGATSKPASEVACFCDVGRVSPCC